MSVFVLYHPKSGPTGRQIRDALDVPGGTRVRGEPEVIIRWGSQREPERGGFNTPQSQALASDKLRTLVRLQEVDVRVPEVSTHWETLEHGTWLARSRHGFGGRDIIVQPEGQITYGFAEAEFYTRYIPNTREYRIHVFNGQVIRVQGKYLDFPEQHTNPYIKNYAQGFRFRTPDRTLNSSRHEAAKAAVSALGLVFGAVDLLIGEDGLEYVLEVNTAPKLAPLTLSQYCDAIKRYVREEYGITIGNA